MVVRQTPVRPTTSPDRTDLSMEEYMKDSFEREQFRHAYSGSDQYHRDTQSDPAFEGLPDGPEFRFTVTRHDLSSLVQRLSGYERRHGLSSVEVFRQYVNGELDHEEDVEEWIDWFLLFLGTSEVQQFVCR